MNAILKFVRHFLLLMFLLSLCSCKDSNRNKIADILREWDGKEVLFPERLAFTIQGKDTVDFDTSGKFKILTYADSAGCLSCKLHLDKWKELINELDTALSDAPKFLFFFSPEKKRDLLSTLKIEDFRHPICIDEQGALNNQNHFPTEMAFQTFLLDENNRVLAIGNPVNNYKVKELYLGIIRGERSNGGKQKDAALTECATDSQSAHMGTFDWRQPQTATFNLSNNNRSCQLNPVLVR